MLWFGSTSLHASLHCMLCSTSKHCMLCIASTSLHATCCGACFNITACFALVQHHCMLDFLDWFASSLPHTSFPPPNITRQKPLKTKAFQTSFTATPSLISPSSPLCVCGKQANPQPFASSRATLNPTCSPSPPSTLAPSLPSTLAAKPFAPHPKP